MYPSSPSADSVYHSLGPSGWDNPRGGVCPQARDPSTDAASRAPRSPRTQHDRCMRRGEWAGDPPEALLRIANRGIIADSTLRSIGVSGSAIHDRCGPGGPWERVLPPGVIHLRNGRLTDRQRSVAALMYSGDTAILTGRAALREYGFDSAGGDGAHILLPAAQRVQSNGFVLVERTHRMPEQVGGRRGLRCAPLVRAVLDAARRCRHSTRPAR